MQSPPNSETLAAVGKLLVDATAVAGFEFYSRVRNGVTDIAGADVSLMLA